MCLPFILYGSKDVFYSLLFFGGVRIAVLSIEVQTDSASLMPTFSYSFLVRISTTSTTRGSRFNISLERTINYHTVSGAYIYNDLGGVGCISYHGHLGACF